MNKIFYFSLILSFASGISYPQQNHTEKLNLKETINLTLKNYPKIKEARQKIELVNSKVKVQESSNYPVVDAEASYTRIGPVPEVILPGGISLDLADENNYTADINISHNIYDFGKRRARTGLIISYVNSATDNLEILKNNLAYSALRTYYTILFLKQSSAVIDTDIATLNEHISIINKKIKAGTATDYDLLSAKVRLTDYQNKIVSINNQLNNQKENLRRLTGLNADTSINIKGKFNLISKKVDNDSLIKSATGSRPEIKIAMDNEKSAELKYDLVSKSNTPNLLLHLSYGIKNGFKPNLDAIRGNWVASVGLSIPIFNGFKTDREETEAQTNIDIAKTSISDVKEEVATQIRKAVEDFNSNYKQIANAKKQVQFATQSVNKARSQYEAGVGTNLDLLDAETRLANARFLLLKKIYTNTLNYYKIKTLAGEKYW
jgi:outer membrane protein TolC